MRSVFCQQIALKSRLSLVSEVTDGSSSNLRSILDALKAAPFRERLEFVTVLDQIREEGIRRKAEEEEIEIEFTTN